MARETPPTPLLLGALGLIPFAGLALARLTGIGTGVGVTPDFARDALATYGAVIASFLGGIRWGVAVARPDDERSALDYALSVLPSLAAWFALALPDPYDLILIAAVIGGLGLVDQDLVRRGRAPAWFGRLRLALSAGAALAMILSAAG